MLPFRPLLLPLVTSSSLIPTLPPTQQVTSLSGFLYKFSKDERRVKLQEALTQFAPPRYVPVCAFCVRVFVCCVMWTIVSCMESPGPVLRQAWLCVCVCVLLTPSPPVNAITTALHVSS